MKSETEDRNAAIVRRAVEKIWRDGNLALSDQFFDATYVNHGGLITDLVHGPESIEISVALLRIAFPDLWIDIERLTAIGDSVEVCWAAQSSSARLSAQGDAGHRLTGTTRGVLVNGKIMESWTDWDHAAAWRLLQRMPEQPSPQA